MRAGSSSRRYRLAGAGSRSLTICSVAALLTTSSASDSSNTGNPLKRPGQSNLLARRGARIGSSSDLDATNATVAQPKWCGVRVATAVASKACRKASGRYAACLECQARRRPRCWCATAGRYCAHSSAGPTRIAGPTNWRRRVQAPRYVSSQLRGPTRASRVVCGDARGTCAQNRRRLAPQRRPP